MAINKRNKNQQISINPFSDGELDKELFFDLKIKPIYDDPINQPCNHENNIVAIDKYSNGMVARCGMCLDCGMNSSFEGETVKITIIRTHKKGTLPKFLKHLEKA
jgi:hypothetical protein